MCSTAAPTPRRPIVIDRQLPRVKHALIGPGTHRRPGPTHPHSVHTPCHTHTCALAVRALRAVLGQERRARGGQEIGSDLRPGGLYQAWLRDVKREVRTRPRYRLSGSGERLKLTLLDIYAASYIFIFYKLLYTRRSFLDPALFFLSCLRTHAHTCTGCAGIVCARSTHYQSWPPQRRAVGAWPWAWRALAGL
jgi:hypothetical protein